MNRSTLTLAAVAFASATAVHAQQTRVPVVALPASNAKTSETFGGIIGVREVSGGKLLVNDAARRQLVLLDTTFRSHTIALDSTDGVANAYGRARAPLLAYLGDSSLMADPQSQSLRVIDGKGQVVRSIALPNPRDVIFMISAASGVDSKGRLVYRGPVPQLPNMQQLPLSQRPDSAVILRADLDARTVDTVGRLKARDGAGVLSDMSDPAKPKLTITINPLPSLDEWALLSNGTIALVRGQDYHIDFIQPDGSRSSSPKLSFDWKRLTDDDKQKLVDSARAAQEAMAAGRGAAPPPADGGGRGRGGAGGGGGGAVGAVGVRGGGPGGGVPPTVETVYLPLAQITDYYPPIRPGAAMADRDGNLWVLPTTSGQSQAGELVYDVINTKGELFQRVRLPSGRSIAGFGTGGVVYMMSGDRTNGFYLERTRLASGTRTASR
ncbi:MAG TPA: hypothetical protein VJR92_15380 [Gemmatimonadaceae bacterium]|nr:hypothetical protein [Gemmatimonadaceae bacterium]